MNTRFGSESCEFGDGTFRSLYSAMNDIRRATKAVRVRNFGVHPGTPDRVIAGVEVGGVHISEDRARREPSVVTASLVASADFGEAFEAISYLVGQPRLFSRRPPSRGMC